MMGGQAPASPTDALAALLADPEAAQRRLAELKAAELAANQAQIDANEAFAKSLAAKEGLEARELAVAERERKVKEDYEQVKNQADNLQRMERAAKERHEFDTKQVAKGIKDNDEREAILRAQQAAFAESQQGYAQQMAEREAALAKREGELQAREARVSEMRSNLERKNSELVTIATRGI